MMTLGRVSVDEYGASTFERNTKMDLAKVSEENFLIKRGLALTWATANAEAFQPEFFPPNELVTEYIPSNSDAYNDDVIDKVADITGK